MTIIIQALTCNHDVMTHCRSGQSCICRCTAQVREQLERFIGVMEQLVDSHRAAAGYAELPLRVY